MGSLGTGSTRARRIALTAAAAAAVAFVVAHERDPSSPPDLAVTERVPSDHAETATESASSAAANPFAVIDAGVPDRRDRPLRSAARSLDGDPPGGQPPPRPGADDGGRTEALRQPAADEPADAALMRWLEANITDVRDEPVASTPTRSADGPRRTATARDGEPEPALRQDELGGDREIGGRVLTPDGDPIEGQIVTAGRRTSERQAIRSAVSDRSGRFLIGGLTAGDYLLRAEESASFAGTSLLARTGSRSLTLVLPRRLLAAIEGVITDGLGTPITGAEVVPTDMTRVLVTDEEGRFAGQVPVAEGHGLSLRYRAEGYLEESRLFDSRDWREGEPLDASMRLRDAGLLSLTGIVLDESGQPVEGAVVRVSSRERDFRLNTETRPSGEFALGGILAATDIELAVNAGRRFEPFAASHVDIDRDAMQLQIVLRSASLGRLVAVVHDPSGNPVPRLDFIAFGSGRERRTAPLSSTIAGQLVLEDFTAGTVTLRSRVPPMIVVRGITVDPGHDNAYLFTVDMGGHTLRGRVLDEGGSPVRGARVSMTRQHVDGGLRTTTTRATSSDSSGEFEFRGLGRGTRRIAVVAEDYADATIVVDPAEGEGFHLVSLSR